MGRAAAQVISLSELLRPNEPRLQRLLHVPGHSAVVVCAPLRYAAAPVCLPVCVTPYAEEKSFMTRLSTPVGMNFPVSQHYMYQYDNVESMPRIFGQPDEYESNCFRRAADPSETPVTVVCWQGRSYCFHLYCQSHWRARVKGLFPLVTPYVQKKRVSVTRLSTPVVMNFLGKPTSHVRL